jgi:hypothetical protein
MSGLPGGEPAGVTLESDAPRQRNSSGGLIDTSRRTLAIYIMHVDLLSLHIGQRQVPSEDSFINSEDEAGDGDAHQQSPPGGSQFTVRLVTTGSAVGGLLQHLLSLGKGQRYAHVQLA